MPRLIVNPQHLNRDEFLTPFDKIFDQMMSKQFPAFQEEVGVSFNQGAYPKVNIYEYDDKINNYLKSFFSFGNKKNNKSSKTQHKFSKSSTKVSKQSFKIKSKNKAIYSFGNGQSLQVNPTNIDSKILYNNTPFSYFEIKKDSLLYGIKLDF